MGLLATALFPLVLIFAAICDLRRFEIPNWVSAVLFVGFFPIAWFIGFDSGALLDHLLCAGAMFVVAALLFFGGIIGGGDAKVLPAAAVWTGWAGLPAFLLFMALSGGVVVVALLIFRRLPLPVGATKIDWLHALHENRNDVPYAVAIAGGGLVVFPNLAIVVAASG